MPNTSVAILLASYNGGRYIDQQLQSIKRQTYRDFRCYIRDDGSDDNTVEIIESYVREDSAHFALIKTSGKKHGSKYNFFELIQYYRQSCDEEYIMFSDQDDIWSAEKVEKEVSQILDCKKPALVFCDQEVVDKNLKRIQTSIHSTMKDYNKFPNSLTYRNVAAGCTMCINRELLNIAFSDINPEQFVMHDWWLMLVAAYLGKIIYLAQPLMQYRQHEDNVLGIDSNNYLAKAHKYIKNFSKSMHNRKTQAGLCEEQMHNLLKRAPQDARLLKYSSIMRKPGVFRIRELVKNSYIEKDNLFTCMFV